MISLTCGIQNATNEPMEQNHGYREYTGHCQGRGDQWRDEGRG